MPDNTTGTTVSSTMGKRTLGISASTPIIFTVKSFFATIGSILGLFVSFYFMIIVPNMKNNVEHQKELYDQQKEFIITEVNDIKKSIDKNTVAIGLNTSAINATNNRFRDLNESVEELHGSGGSFGQVSMNDGGASDGSLASTHD